MTAEPQDLPDIMPSPKGMRFMAFAYGFCALLFLPFAGLLGLILFYFLREGWAWISEPSAWLVLTLFVAFGTAVAALILACLAHWRLAYQRLPVLQFQPNGVALRPNLRRGLSHFLRFEDIEGIEEQREVTGSILRVGLILREGAFSKISPHLTWSQLLAFRLWKRRRVGYRYNMLDIRGESFTEQMQTAMQRAGFQVIQTRKPNLALPNAAWRFERDGETR